MLLRFFFAYFEDMKAIGKNIYSGGGGLPESFMVLRDRVLCLDDKDGYWNFFRLAWHVLENKPLKEGWYMRWVCRRAQKHIDRIARGEAKDKDEIFCLPPRTGKSNLLSVFLNAYAWTRYPWMKFITCSYSDSLSVQHSTATKKILMSEWFLKRWGDVVKVNLNDGEVEVGGCRLKGKVTERVFETSAGGRRVSSSVGGTVTGKGADVIIADDLTSVKEGRSSAQREEAATFYRETLFNRLDEALVGVRMLMQQRVHAEDVVGKELEENRDLYHLTNLPAEVVKGVKVEPERLEELYYVDEEGNILLDGVRFPKSVLATFERVMFDYREQYLQDPKGVGGNIWNPDWFFEWTWEELMAKFERKGEVPVWYFEFDGAYTAKKSNAPNVCFAYCLLDNRAYVRAIFRRWMIFTDLVEELPLFLLKNGYNDSSELRVEPKANGKDLVPSMVEWSGINAVESYNPTDDKELAASLVSPIVKAGRVGFLKGMEGLKDFYDEVRLFPQGAYKDQVDVTVMVINNGLKGSEDGILASG